MCVTTPKHFCHFIPENSRYLKYTNFFERLSISTSNRFAHISHIFVTTRSKESQRLATVLRGGWTEVEFQSKDVFLSSEKFRAALGPTEPPIQWASSFFFKGQSGQSVAPTTQLHIASKFRVRGAVPLFLLCLLAM